MGETSRKLQFLQEMVVMATAPLIAYFLFRRILSRLDPESGEKGEAQQKANAAQQRLNSLFSRQRQIEDNSEDDSEDEESESRYGKRLRQEQLHLNSYEQTIAMDVVAPEEIPVSFEDIGGLEDIIEELKESVIYPLTMPHLYASSSSLLSAPSGVLLYGPPGCGKTMIAKALAHESGACFINLHISTVTEKWYGDSNKLVSAVFSLARKLQPSIVFIDEIDAVLGQRRSGEHEASGMVKAEFMTQWDGLSSANSHGMPQRICILGATNRIQDIDEAILRRMPKKFPVPLPSAHQRRGILELILRDTKVDKPNMDMDYLVRVSAGMSGSDLKDACRDAVMVPVREYIRTKKAEGSLRKGVNAKDVRGIRTSDFFGTKGSVHQMRETHTKILANDIDEPESDRAVETESDTSSAEEFKDSAYQDDARK